MLRVEALHIQAGKMCLRDITFTVEDGCYFVLLGASGAGKTLLLEALAGLQPIKAGRIAWNDKDLTRARIQHRGMGALFPHLTVRQNIAYGAVGSPDETRQIIEKVGVSHLLARYPGTLSGGEAQRVALARALATRPRCLLLDEPLSSLDVHAKDTMRSLLRALQRGGQTVIHVTHDYEEALALATHVAIIENGGIAQTGTPARIFQHPKSEFVARFVGIRNVFPGRLEGENDVNGDTITFNSNGVLFSVMTCKKHGEGTMLVRGEDIILSAHRMESSAKNCFQGKITDIVPARLGAEVYVDIGVEIAALVTNASAENLGLRDGNNVWISFKASAARFLEN